jgi:putative tryptophan/tyrosine transport system substrate-binding protein
MTKLFSVWLLTIFLLTTVTVADAQSPTEKTPVIGVFLPDSPAAYASYVESFREGLGELGYVIGKNILVEYRYAEGKRDRVPELAAELVRLKVDVIVVVGGTLAATKRATSAVPIVVGTAGDLVGGGYVTSLARPGGNITGSTNVDSDFSAKRLELLKEAFPKLSRVAVFTHEGNQGDQDELRETRTAAQRLGVRIQSQDIIDTGEFQAAFAAIIKERTEALIVTNPIKERTEALIVTNNSFNFSHRRQFVEFAEKNRLPTMCGRAAFVEDGCLISYAGSRHDSMRRAAYFVDKILKGAKPADLPVQQPTKFELVINLKTAKQIGLTIPPNLLARADRVIK